MKVKLLKLMICPFCEGKLECFIEKSVIKLYNDSSFNQPCGSKCQVIETDNHSINLNSDCVKCHNLHIVEGHLYCKECVKKYPVIESIPRFFDLQESKLCRDDVTGNTSESFSLQWGKMRKYYEYGMGDFIKDISPYDRYYFKDKIVLDAGCAYGRHIVHSARLAKEVIGIDISKAVEDAYDRAIDYPNVHFIQCDINKPPLSIESFDFIYSIGVLQHLQNPSWGFKQLVRRLKKGGAIFIWVYKRDDILSFIKMKLVEPFRRVVSGWHWKVISGLSLFPAVIERLFFNYPYLFMRNIRVSNNLLKLIPFKAHADVPFMVIVTTWYDRLKTPVNHYFTKEEIEQWFREEGFEDININKNWNGKAHGIK